MEYNLLGNKHAMFSPSMIALLRKQVVIYRYFLCLSVVPRQQHPKLHSQDSHH